MWLVDGSDLHFRHSKWKSNYKIDVEAALKRQYLVVWEGAVLGEAWHQ